MDFNTAVLERSYERPVVVDFWAPWCGPCRVLGPTIEKLAEEQSDKWDLVKLNTEEDPMIAQEYQIRSIPNVKLFYEGEVIAEFAGAQPRSVIEKWLLEHLPDDRKQNFESLLEEASEPEGLAKLEAFVAENPDLPAAAVSLAKHLVFTEPERAVDLVATIKLGDEFADTAEDVRSIAEFLHYESDGSPAGEVLAGAQASLLQGEGETAIQQIIQAVTLDKTLAKDLPRRTAIGLFRILGNAHPLTKNYRWRFDMALY
ncbi:MAG: thioredoxin [Saprospiraceae bacterium]